MAWDLDKAADYYKKMGAPSDQNAVINLLREIQQENGGSIPQWVPVVVAEKLGTKPGLLLALIRRIPSLRLGEGHLLELCAGPNCGKHTHLLRLAEELAKGRSDVTVKTIPCQRLCGKGPNIRYDGVLHHKADEALIRDLLKK